MCICSTNVFFLINIIIHNCRPIKATLSVQDTGAIYEPVSVIIMLFKPEYCAIRLYLFIYKYKLSDFFDNWTSAWVYNNMLSVAFVEIH